MSRPLLLVPFDKREAITPEVAASIADRSPETIRGWCARYDIATRALPFGPVLDPNRTWSGPASPDRHTIAPTPAPNKTVLISGPTALLPPKVPVEPIEEILGLSLPEADATASSGTRRRDPGWG